MNSAATRRKPDSSVRTVLQAAAQKAKLKYVEDSAPGIQRQKRGKSFRYVGSHGRVIRTEKVLKRIISLAIPPGWERVWICEDADGHLQATGRDARGRKQYRYHPRFREFQDNAKYDNVIAFAQALPKIRRRVQRDLSRKPLSRTKVLAAMVRLLETTLIRIGNDEYTRTNGSFGVTTLRDRHVKVTGGKISFEFRGKSGIEHEIHLKDSRLAVIVRQCQELPGQQLFQYVDEQDQVQDVSSTDVNEYLRHISGGEFTAKDFRTWAGTVLAAEALQEFEDFDSQAAAKRNITTATERVAERLGNTKSICRKCYVHPAIFEAYLDHSLLELLKARTERELRDRLPALPAEEAAVMAFLQQRMERQLHGTRPLAAKRRRSRSLK